MTIAVSVKRDPSATTGRCWTVEINGETKTFSNAVNVLAALTTAGVEGVESLLLINAALERKRP